MSTSPSTGSAGGSGIATRLGIASGQIVLEIGHDTDCDQDLRQQVVAMSGSELLAGETDEVVDVALLWWREDDGDLVDALVDALTYLADGGVIWVLTPKAGRPGHVEPSDLQEAAPTAGLSQTSSFAAAKDWTATKLVTPKSRR